MPTPSLCTQNELCVLGRTRQSTAITAWGSTSCVRPSWTRSSSSVSTARRPWASSSSIKMIWSRRWTSSGFLSEYVEKKKNKAVYWAKLGSTGIPPALGDMHFSHYLGVTALVSVEGNLFLTIVSDSLWNSDDNAVAHHETKRLLNCKRAAFAWAREKKRKKTTTFLVIFILVSVSCLLSGWIL